MVLYMVVLIEIQILFHKQMELKDFLEELDLIFLNNLMKNIS